MNKLIIRKIPIEDKDQQTIDIDIDKMKEEIQNSMKDYALEYVTYTINENHLSILFVMRQYTIKGIGFRTAG
jgi:hypothetical protein